MAKPRVFISSTFYDLKHIREDIGRFVESQGFEPVLFERGDIPYGKHQAPQEYCYNEIESCDLLVSLIGGRYGSEASSGKYSITQKELKHAIEIGKQVYIFVDNNVKSELETYKINRDNSNIQYKYVDNPRVYEFIAEIELIQKNNAIFPFQYPQDIITILRDQWAGLFHRLLQEENERIRFNMIRELENLVTSLTRTLEIIIGDPTDKEQIINDVQLFRHPAVACLKEVLGINHSIGFCSFDQLMQLLADHGYNYDYNSSDGSSDHYWSRDTDTQTKCITIKRCIFDNEGTLIYSSKTDWDKGLIDSFVIDKEIDEIPF